PYPKSLRFPLVDKAGYADNDVPLQVFVPIMESIAAGNGTQNVLMRIDWTTLAFDDGSAKDDEDGKNNNKTTPSAVKADISQAQVAIAKSIAWTGRQAKPKATVKLGGKTLAEGKDYTLAYGANKNIGKGSVTVKGAGSYKGAKTAEFKILPQKMKLSKVTAAKKRIKATWKKAKSAQKLTGYQIRYRVASGKWKTKTVTAKKATLTINSLKKGKKYQVQIRAYKQIGKATYPAPWSATKKSGKVK
ncbi:MAG: fibronectin type III domain-containing protein, partial [Clostridiales Family XIII bacterium]|nr:fibronectin type III domain-containing protein [Clostridiales Family XIII bacterium]